MNAIECDLFGHELEPILVRARASVDPKNATNIRLEFPVDNYGSAAMKLVFFLVE
jgi:hypothetical protein